MSSYRFPAGVKFLGKSGSNFTLAVTMPADDEGFFGRECPSCRGHFRVASDDYEALPDDQMLWCVYCGHHDHNDDFITAQADGPFGSSRHQPRGADGEQDAGRDIRQDVTSFAWFA